MDYKRKSLWTIKKSLWTRPAGRKLYPRQSYLQGVPFQGKHQENEHRVEHFGANHSCSIRQARGERGSHRHTIFGLQQCIDVKTNNRKRGYNKHQSISISVYQHLSAFSISNQPFLFWSNGCIVSYYHK